MPNKLYIYQGRGVDPYENLAIERFLLENRPEGSCILYLWQNKNTVVIGRNQNPWKECRTTLLVQEGGKLSRRLSGGGAVFHDLGNLNFTFLTSAEDYDLDKQLRVIQTACGSLGIPAERSGRNDVLAQGRKFSGNAFYQNRKNAYHHGTLMVDVDMDKLHRYLSPPKAKLEAKGVDSVRSRVINLRELAPTLTCDGLRQAMTDAFEAVYGLSAEPFGLDGNAKSIIKALRQENAAWEWLYGPSLPFTFSCESHFSWGNLQLQLRAEAGLVQSVKVYTDAMDWQLASIIEKALTGCRFIPGDLQAALYAAFLPNPQIGQDLCQMLAEQEL